MWNKVIETRGSAAVILIRLMVGAVFLSEGIQKFLFPGEVGAGRFAKIGLPSPEILAPFVATFEITCGALVPFGVLTRFAVIPPLIIMAVVRTATKIPILINSGFWKMAHESRTDFSMVMGSLFLLIEGAGKWSLDMKLLSRRKLSEPQSLD